MAKRSFLKPLSAIIAALASATPWAAKAAVDTSAPLAPEANQRAAVDTASAPIGVNEARELLLRDDGELFKFVLKRSEDGRLLADHWSHSSHGSHSSHSSHYSGRKPKSWSPRPLPWTRRRGKCSSRLRHTRWKLSSARHTASSTVLASNFFPILRAVNASSFSRVAPPRLRSRRTCGTSTQSSLIRTFGE